MIWSGGQFSRDSCANSSPSPWCVVSEEPSPVRTDYLDSPGFPSILSLDSVSWFPMLKQTSHVSASPSLNGTCSHFFPNWITSFEGSQMPGSKAPRAGYGGVQGSRNGGLWPVTSEDGGLAVHLAVLSCSLMRTWELSWGGQQVDVAHTWQPPPAGRWQGSHTQIFY